MSVVVPVRNDAANLERLLNTLNTLMPAGWEVVVVDGGSHDDSVGVAERLRARVVETAAGRGRQLRRGVAESRGGLVWLLHADSGLNAEVIDALERVRQQSFVWGRFDVSLEPGTRGVRSRVMCALVARLMNWRSRVTGVCTGDQAVFVSRRLLEAVGGIPDQPLMEDVELSKRLRARQRPMILAPTVCTSARRWETRGWARTIALMWWLRLRYFCGASPERLAAEYYR